MSNILFDESIKEQLSAKFPFLSDKIRIARPRRIFAEVLYKEFRPVFEHIVKELNFQTICAITGLDEADKFSFIYHLTSDTGTILSLKTSVSKGDPVIRSVIDIFPSAEYYERELVDLFGVNVEGLPEGNRYPLTDDWPKGQYPLRKDWKLSTCQEGGIL